MILLNSGCGVLNYTGNLFQFKLVEHRIFCDNNFIKTPSLLSFVSLELKDYGFKKDII